MESGKLAFLGLGVMGFPMAGHLARAGHSVIVYNRTPAKAAQWVEKYGGSSAPTPAAAAADAALVRRASASSTLPCRADRRARKMAS